MIGGCIMVGITEQKGEDLGEAGKRCLSDVCSFEVGGEGLTLHDDWAHFSQRSQADEKSVRGNALK